MIEGYHSLLLSSTKSHKINLNLPVFLNVDTCTKECEKFPFGVTESKNLLNAGFLLIISPSDIKPMVRSAGSHISLTTYQANS